MKKQITLNHLISLLIGLTVGNFLCSLLGDLTLSMAINNSFFEAVALFIIWATANPVEDQ